MTQPAISILLPTRGRPEMLQVLLESIAKTASAPDALEILLYIDADDAPTAAIDQPRLNLIRHVGPRTGMGRMTRELYGRSSGSHLFLLNDDVFIHTAGWDESLLHASGQYPDGVGLIYGNDLHQGPQLPTFPFLPRRTCELLGGPCPAQYQHNYIDTQLLDIFLRLKRRGADRIAYLDEVVFEHLHADAGKAPAARMAADASAQDELVYVTWDAEREYLAYRLWRAISESPAQLPGPAIDAGSEKDLSYPGQ